MSQNQFSWAVAANLIGGCFGCLITGLIRNKFGTKISIYIFCVPSFCGWILLTFSFNWWMVILGRFIIGIAASSFNFNVLVYIGECASKEIRGILLSFFEMSLKFGILFSYVIGSFTKQQVTNAVCASIVIFYAISFSFLPESPLYLMKQHKAEKAKKSLIRLRGSNFKIDDEMTNLKEEIEELERTKKPFWQELSIKATRKAFFILIAMFFFFQMCGINAIVYYTTIIFIESGLTIDPFIATCILGIIQVVSISCTLAFVDRCGRKPLLIISNAVMIFGLFGFGIYFHIKENINVSGFELLPLFMLGIFMIGFSIGVGNVTFVLMGEMFSLNAKRFFGPLTQFMNYLTSFSIAIFFPLVANSIGMHFAFYFFGLCCIFAIIFIIFILPETKGKTLVEIQKLLS
ncbi:hypothetical protein PVAND_012356 [Polypedilum vanderplanki]|uniref:Major facilitator superfamily (MFS) profile domain-containing protein n=1 Tax=Polypedilum vanderplanki TaxID=319348 RepID=A0A9J6CLC5_POLVA|nr:hypothetical protein PVAND_012356 [Polypedilum vanderplanki]